MEILLLAPTKVWVKTSPSLITANPSATYMQLLLLKSYALIGYTIHVVGCLPPEELKPMFSLVEIEGDQLQITQKQA